VRDNFASTITKISNCEHSDDPNSLRSCIVTIHKSMGMLNATAVVIHDKESEGFIKATTNFALSGLALITIPVVTYDVVLVALPLVLGYLGLSGIGADAVLNIFRRKSKHAPSPAVGPDDALTP
jgi:hypothetical protein